MKQIKRTVLRGAVHYALLFAILTSTFVIVMPRLSTYTAAYYSDDTYKTLESVFNSSQYRQKDNPAIIPDETVFSYVAGAYLRGMDPIMANSEHTPLGKYFLAASIFIFHNDKTIILLFAVLSGVSIYLVARAVLRDSTLALVPVLLVSFDTLFRNQLITVPLLDIIQLPFIYFALAAFFYERISGRFLWTALSIGCVMATKSVVPGLLLIICMGLNLILHIQLRILPHFVSWLGLSALIVIVSYIRTFISGYTFWDFLKFQKWIFFYQKSKLIYPFSSLRLLLFNQWQSWWGDFSILRAEDWSYLWPVSTIVSFVMAIWLALKKRWQQVSFSPVVLILFWIIIYQTFLSIGVVSSRFFIPVLPAQYILLVYAVRLLLSYKKIPKILVMSVIIFLGLVLVPRQAQAEYMLPYPSYMPGNKLYRISRLLDRAKQPLYFGSIASYKYHLALSDKYLVEAKILFEYKQYLLATDALKRSDEQFKQAPHHLARAEGEGKDIRVLSAQFREAATVHKTVLVRLQAFVPETFTWEPEKATPTVLALHDLLDESIRIRDSL
jgi:hypothetical protein